MKTALITTTINVPHVLEHYRAIGSNVRFFVAGDQKSPHQAIGDLLETIGRSGYGEEACEPYYHPVDQEGLNYACSELIGWNSIQRRNIALLEAVKWGAEIIVSTDDDNIPLDWDYFQRFTETLDARLWNGCRATGQSFDVGQLLDPIAPHRGFPLNYGKNFKIESVVGAKIGVAAGICLGDPDVSAVTRMANAPVVHRVSELLRTGIVVKPGTKTVFNSQNSAFIRELAPAFFMLPGVGRYDDIFASLIMQRVMQERAWHVHFGQPFVWQQRNQHNLVRDLENELYGMERMQRFVTHLERLSLSTGATVLSHVRQIWNSFDHTPNSYDLVPKRTIEAALAFCDDMEKVL